MALYSQYVVTSDLLQSIKPVIYGHEDCKAGHSFGPAVRPYCLLHYVLKGEGTFHKNGRTYSLTKGDIFVILPGEVTTYQASESNPWEYTWLGFTVEKIPPCLLAPVLRNPPVRHIFTFLRDHHQEDDLDGKIFSLTHELLWILSKSQSKEPAKISNYAAYTKTYLENTYMHQISIRDVSDKLHIDRRYLTILFRKTYGVPPQTFLVNLRLDKAQEFLKKGYRVTEACAMSGFTDLSNFSRQYKAKFGITPRDDK